jgi:hypothetical protein
MGGRRYGMSGYLKGWALVFMVIVTGFAMGSPAASARSGFTVYPGERMHVFHLGASRGFQVLVVLGPTSASLEAIGKSGVVSYTAPVNQEGERFAVRFGRFGKVKMRFKPSAAPVPTTEPQGDCRGRLALVQQGVFRGWFSWRGDQGFSHARRRIIPGTFIRTFREVCRGSSAAVNEDEPDEPQITTRSIDPHGAREVEVYEYPAGERFVTARLVEERPRLRISRTVVAGVQDADVGSKVAPGYPFRGTASLSPDSNGSAAWLGDLEAKFPGRGFTPLAGRSFEVGAVD